MNEMDRPSAVVRRTTNSNNDDIRERDPNTRQGIGIGSVHPWQARLVLRAPWQESEKKLRQVRRRTGPGAKERREALVWTNQHPGSGATD